MVMMVIVDFESGFCGLVTVEGPKLGINTGFQTI